MAAKGDSEGFVSSPLDGQGARHMDSYFPMSDENTAELTDTDTEFKRLKTDFLRIAHDRRRRVLSRNESSRSPSPIGRQPQRRSTNLPKFKIFTFYSTDVELWFNQIETQFDLHQFTDDDERYRLTCAALSGEVASDVRDVLLQPFLTHKYENLKAISIERRGLTTPERVNKVISGEKLGSDIPSSFLRRLQKTAGFGTKAVVGKAVIRQAFIRQMPTSVRAHLATQPDSASLESLAMLADRAVAAEKDVDEAKPGAAEIQVSESGKLVGLLDDLSRRLKKLETATATAAKKKTYGRSQVTENRATKTQFVPNVQAKPFVTKMLLDKMFPRIIKKIVVLTHRCRIYSKITLFNRSTQPMHLSVFITKHLVTEHAHAENLARFLQTSRPEQGSDSCIWRNSRGTTGHCGSSPSQLILSKLTYVADKHNECKYLNDTGAALSVLPKSCANRTSDATCLPLVAANNTTINTYGTSRRVIAVGLKRDYAWTFIVADIKQPIIGADFLIHYSLLVD